MKCENCDVEITFWAMLKQPTPFQFKCTRCRTRYKVQTPHMNRIIVGIFFLLVVLTAGLLAGAKRFGAVFLVPYLLLLAGILLAIEVWTQKYIFRKGKFVKIVKPAKPGRQA